MINKDKSILKSLSFLGPELQSEILNSAILKKIPAETLILREGQYVKVIPYVISGLIKVMSRFEDRELLLYYIRPNESCVMSFSASLKNEASSVFAITEEDTSVILLPVEKVAEWVAQYPSINTLFYQQYNLRYHELLSTISHVLFNKMDKRLHDYLKKKCQLTNKTRIKISHRQIASELGTAREVVSRVMKKLETEGKVRQLVQEIEVLD